MTIGKEDVTKDDYVIEVRINGFKELGYNSYAGPYLDGLRREPIDFNPNVRFLYNFSATAT